MDSYRNQQSGNDLHKVARQKRALERPLGRMKDERPPGHFLWTNVRVPILVYWLVEERAWFFLSQCWKNQRQVALFRDGRIIMVCPSDPKFMHNKMEEIGRVVDR